MSEEVEQVQGTYDMYDDWEEDPKGYFLIKVYPEEQKMGIRFCDPKTHKPQIDIFGKTPQELYITAIKKGLVTKLQHAAYLGKELHKAYTCLKLNKPYEQDEELKY
jgi:tetrahydromethanopterin S-methyltransferase subunit A